MRRLAVASTLAVAWLVCVPALALATTTDDAPTDDAVPGDDEAEESAEEPGADDTGTTPDPDAGTDVGIAVTVGRSPCGVLPEAPFDAIVDALGDDTTSGVDVVGVDRAPTDDDEVVAGVPMTVVADGGGLLAVEVPVGPCEDEVEVGGVAVDAEPPAPPASSTADAAPPRLAATGPTSTLLGLALGQLLCGAGLVLRARPRHAETVDG